MKILLLSHGFYPVIGGIETMSEFLGDFLTQAGHQVRLLTWAEEDTSKKKFEFIVTRKPSISTLLRAHAWADLVLENNPAVRLAWPKLLFSKPSLVVLHTWIARVDGSVSSRDRFKLRFWLGRARTVIAVSAALREVCGQNATVISNPYRSALFRIIPTVQKAKHFVFLGRLVSDKGADLAIRAVHRLNAAMVAAGSLQGRVKLTIIGDGPERKNLEQLVSELMLAEMVSFAGSLTGEELVEMLNEHRYLLAPSRWKEPFGLVALEGMACGCLPIVSDGGGMPEAVGNAGLTFKRGDLDSLVSTILRLLKDPQLEQDLRNKFAGHLTAHTELKVGTKYLQVVNSLLQ